jgi:hypothetical protein
MIHSGLTAHHTPTFSLCNGPTCIALGYSCSILCQLMHNCYLYGYTQHFLQLAHITADSRLSHLALAKTPVGWCSDFVSVVPLIASLLLEVSMSGWNLFWYEVHYWIACVLNPFFSQLTAEETQHGYFQQDNATAHTAHATIVARREGF